MVIQVVNIVGGFVLAAPKIKEWVSKEHVEGAEQKLNKFRGTIGLVALILGVIALLGNLGLYYPPYMLWGMPLQSIAAVVIGLILSANFFAKWPKVAAFVASLEKNSEWIGIAAIIIGILGLI
jgi:hypothetical protein